MSDKKQSYDGPERRSPESIKFRTIIDSLNAKGPEIKKALSDFKHEFARLLHLIATPDEPMTPTRASHLHQDLDRLDVLDFIDGMSGIIHDMHVSIDACLERDSGGGNFKHNYLHVKEPD